MAGHNDLGRRGEEEACRYLAENDYRLLDRNWRHAHLEIDIVAEYYGELVFVEVKTRSNADAAEDAARLSPEKRKRLVDAARIYMACHKTDRPYRFDVIAIRPEGGTFGIEHFKNAFGVTDTAETANKTHHGH